MIKTLKVFAEGEALVPDYEALEQGKLRFIGRKRIAAEGINGGWVPQLESVEVPFRLEYLQELKAGALAPADEDTARAAGIDFWLNKIK
jgi:hypothetical protein